MTPQELAIVAEAQQLVDSGAATWDTTCWECPCGQEPCKPGRTTTPVRTLVSLREPYCRFCGKAYQEEWQLDANSSFCGFSTC